MANVLERAVDYDLSPAYRWWRGLPVVERCFLYLPVVSIPALLTAGGTLYMWRNTPGTIVFGWLFCGLGQIATVFLAWALAKRWNRFWPYALILLRVTLAQQILIKGSPELFLRWPAPCEFMEFLLLIEAITFLASVDLLRVLKRKAAQGAQAAESPKAGAGLSDLDEVQREEAAGQEHAQIRPTSRRSITVRGLWNEFPLWMRWIYCWGLVFVPGIVLRSVVMESRHMFGGDSLFYLFVEEPLLLFAILISGTMFIPSHKYVLMCAVTAFCMVDSAKFSLYLWASNSSNMDNYIIYRNNFAFVVIESVVIYVTAFWYIRRRSLQ